MMLLLRYYQIVLILRILYCTLVGHRWSIIKWEFAGRKNEENGHKSKHNVRHESCLRCYAKRSLVNDDLGHLIFHYKKRIWQERRKVLVEKHENKKREYVIEVRHISFDNPLFVHKGFYVFDSEIEAEQRRLDAHIKENNPAIADNNEYSIKYVLLDEKVTIKKVEEELPEELRT